MASDSRPVSCGHCGRYLSPTVERVVPAPHGARHRRRIEQFRCDRCGFGGARTYDAKTETLCFTSGPVFNPVRYKKQRAASRDEPAEPLDGPLGSRPVGWEVVADD